MTAEFSGLWEYLGRVRGLLVRQKSGHSQIEKMRKVLWSLDKDGPEITQTCRAYLIDSAEWQTTLG